MGNTINMDARSYRSEKSLSPFLAKAGAARTGEDQLPGYYCEQQQMWVVDTEQGLLPIINEQALSQLMTKTRTHEEEDDDSYLALELMTKTHQQTESDDDTGPIGYNHLLQLATKTDSIQEVDDNYSASQLLELVTKTNVEQEADDDGFQFLGFRS
ncbi:hypothetical protein [Chromohalobacter israelensis]|uniref:hypothetical protein n=1 Tax=Chromohalobacter israelensis TaxID=141390 RepID=UPI00196BAA06|nr:hypothetical protein [Chromohalobacter salexigens]